MNFILKLLILSLLCLPVFSKTGYIVYLSAKGIGASSFGHTYFAISDGDIHRAKLYEFVAESGEQINILRGVGLKESYKLLLQDKSMFSEKRSQLLKEDRDMIFYELNLDDQQVEEIETELSQIRDKTNYSSLEYNFFTKNCTSVWSEIFDDIFNTKNTAFDNIPFLFVKKLKSAGVIISETKLNRYSKERYALLNEHLSETQFHITKKHLLKSAKSSDINTRKNIFYYLASFDQEEVAKLYRRFEFPFLGNDYAKNLRGKYSYIIHSLGELYFSPKRLRFETRPHYDLLYIQSDSSSHHRLRHKEVCEYERCDYFIHDKEIIKVGFLKRN